MNHKVQSVVDNLEIIKQLYDVSTYISVLDKDGILVGYVIPDGEIPKHFLLYKYRYRYSSLIH